MSYDDFSAGKLYLLCMVIATSVAAPNPAFHYLTLLLLRAEGFQIGSSNGCVTTVEYASILLSIALRINTKLTIEKKKRGRKNNNSQSSNVGILYQFVLYFPSTQFDLCLT